jgi:hypothetical protein
VDSLTLTWKDGETVHVIREGLPQGVESSTDYTLKRRHGQLKYDVVLVRDIEPRKQDKTLNCWLTAAQMLVAWHEQQSLETDAILNRLPPQYRQWYEGNTGLPYEESENFANALGMKTEAPRSYSVEEMIELLRDHGPMLIRVGENDPKLSHDVAVVGVRGDGSATDSYITIIDPMVGEPQEWGYADFMQEFYGAAATQHGVRGMHY